MQSRRAQRERTGVGVGVDSNASAAIFRRTAINHQFARAPHHSAPVLYSTFKFLHVLGAIILVGNVTVTAVWKVFADRTNDARVVAFGQRLVTITDWSLTGGGIVLIVVGGYGATYVGRMNPFGASWLVWGQLLFALSGIMWAAILIPIQMRQARAAREFAHSGEISAAYRLDAKRWLVWGIIATVPLVGAVWFMVFKPM